MLRQPVDITFLNVHTLAETEKVSIIILNKYVY